MDTARIKNPSALKNHSSVNNKAGLNLCIATCKKKTTPSITQFSRESVVALTAYFEYIVEWIIYNASCITKNEGRSNVKPHDVMQTLKAEWLFSIMADVEIRPANGLLFDGNFEDKFKAIYRTSNVSKNTRIKNKRKLEEQRVENLFLFDISNKKIKELPNMQITKDSSNGNVRKENK